MACALRLSGDWAVAVFVVGFLSDALVFGCGSLVDCLASLVALGLLIAGAVSLPLFAFLSLKNWIRGVVVTFSLPFSSEPTL